MNSLSKAFICLFGFLSATLLFLALFRLANGKSAFISLSDLYYYFQDIDVMKPFNKFVDYLEGLKNDFVIDISNIDSWNFKIESFSDIWDSFINFFAYVGTLLYDIIKFVGFPFYLSYYIIEFIVNLFGSLFGFLSNSLL